MTRKSSKTEKHRAQKLLGLLKFDIKRYDACADMSATDWAWVLHLRYLMRGTYIGPEIRAQCEERGGADPGLHLLSQYFDHPAGKKGLEPVWGKGEPQERARRRYRAVSDVDILGVWSSREHLENLPEATEACMEHDRLLSSADRDFRPPTLVYTSLHSHMLVNDAARNSRWDMAWVNVNLRATDEQIKAQFASWLGSKRTELRLHGISVDMPNKFSQSDFRKWHEHRVLAYIDLDLFAYHFSMSLTDEMIGNRLFPDAPDIDTGERVRKTVRPLASWLMLSETIDALEWQSGYEYYKKAEEKR